MDEALLAISCLLSAAAIVLAPAVLVAVMIVDVVVVFIDRERQNYRRVLEKQPTGFSQSI